MPDPCDQFTVGTVLPGPFLITKVENGKVTIEGLSVGGSPIAIEFDCATFFQGFYGLLDLLGIPHP